MVSASLAARTTPCARCTSPLEGGDLRCAVCAMIAPTHASTALSPAEAERARILRCKECTAAMAYSAEKKALACPFCGAAVEVEVPEDPVEVAELRVPFGVDKSTARNALQGWLKSRGFFRPSDLSSASSLDSIHPLSWAAWVCKAQALVTWTADSDAGSGRSQWAPHSGEEAHAWDALIVSASRGLSNLEAKAMADAYDLGAAQRVADITVAANEVVESFDLQRSAARSTILTAIEARVVEQLKKGAIPGSRFRKVHASVMLQGLTTSRVVLPAWVLVYRYGKKRFRAVVHGQNVQVITGEAPLSWIKITLVTLAMLAVIGGVAGAILWSTLRHH